MMREPKKKRGAKKWIILICAACVLFIFRKSLAIGVLKVALDFSLSGNTSSFTYEKIQWENDIIRIDDISYVNNDAEILIDQVNIALSGILFSWQVHCKVFHPQIYVKHGGASQSAPLHFLLAPQDLTSCAKIFWELHDGVLHLDENPPLYFSFLPDAIEHRKGKIALSYEPHNAHAPLFTALIEEKDAIFEMEFSLIEEDCSRLLPLALALFPELPREWEKTQGNVAASGKLFVDQHGCLSELSCQWEVEQLALGSASSGIELSAQHLSGCLSSDVLLPLDQLWLKGKGNMLFQGLEFSLSSLTPYHFRIDNGEIALEPNREPYLAIKGICNYDDKCLPFSFSASGELHADAAFFLKFQGECENSLQLDGSICHFDEGKYAVQLHFENFLFEHLEFLTVPLPFHWKKEEWIEGVSSGTATLIWENETLQTDVELTSGAEKVIAGALFDTLSPLKIKEGWFETEKITERIYSPLLKLFAIDIPFSGEVQLKGNFDPSYLVLSLQGSDCALHHDQGDLLFSSFGETGIELVYSVKEKKLKGEIPLLDAKWSSRDPLYNMDSLNATVYLDGKMLNIPSFSGKCQGILFQGKLGSLHFDPTLHKFELEKTEVKWSLQSGSAFHLNLAQCVIDYVKENASANFHLYLDRNQQRVLELAGSAQRGKLAQWDIAFDRQKTHFLDTLLHISGCHISPERHMALQMHPVLSCEKLLKNLTWLSEAGIFSFPIEKIRELPCQGTLQIHFSTNDFKKDPLYFKIESKDLSIQGNTLSFFVLEGNKSAQHIEIKECRGDGFAFKACGDLEECSVKLIDLEGQYRGTAIKAAGDLNLSTYAFNVSLDSIKGNTSAFIPADPCAGTFSAYGTLKGVLSTPFSFDADAVCTMDIAKPLAITAWNVKPLKISYAQGSGLRIQELSAYLKSKKEGIILGLISLGQCRIPSTWDTLQEGACQFSVHSLLLKECADAHLLPAFFSEALFSEKIEGTAEFQKGSDGWICRAALKDGPFPLQNTPLTLQKIALQCQRGVFTVQAKTTIGQQSLWGALSIALTKNPQAILRITDDPNQDGIRVHFKCKEDQMLWEKIHGSCLGLHCALTKSDAKKTGATSILSGRIDIDASQLSSFFSPTVKEKWAQWKLGKGYSWQGDLILYADPNRRFQMTGEIIGEEWELLGYRFKKLCGSVDVHPHYILLSNVLLEDEAGTIAIKKMEMEKKEQWELTIPLISIREWHPSSMRKIDALPSAIKPFLIRNFTLSGIHADLNKPESLEGRGKLTFTNYSKKEATLLDTPIEMIKNFGLDPGLLTPTQGEIDIDLKGDKMYLVGLKDAFSEAKRSEFYLAPHREPSYIDLGGKMHIDLKMRQDVTLKITEPFILTIRGTLGNPRFGINLLP